MSDIRRDFRKAVFDESKIEHGMEIFSQLIGQNPEVSVESFLDLEEESHTIALDSIVVVARVEDYDAERLNQDVLEKYKSFPREGLRCPLCDKDLVCSNLVWGVHQNRQKLTFVCSVCAIAMSPEEALTKIREKQWGDQEAQ